MDPQQQAIAEEFDQYRESYDDAVNRAIAFSGQKVQAFTRAKAHDLLRTIAAHFGSPRKLNLLDVGCGIGNYHPFLTPVVGTVSGVDVSSACIAKAQERNPSVSYSVYDGDRLAVSGRAFRRRLLYLCDPPRSRRSAGSHSRTRCGRVTRAGGLIVVYEHNPKHPLTLKVVRDCAFDRDAVLLTMAQSRALLESAGCSNVTTSSILTLPPMGGFVERLDSLLARLPFGSQYRAVGRVS